MHATAPGWQQPVAGELVPKEGALPGRLLSRRTGPALDPTFHALVFSVAVVERTRQPRRPVAVPDREGNERCQRRRRAPGGPEMRPGFGERAGRAGRDAAVHGCERLLEVAAGERIEQERSTG